MTGVYVAGRDRQRRRHRARGRPARQHGHRHRACRARRHPARFEHRHRTAEDHHPQRRRRSGASYTYTLALNGSGATLVNNVYKAGVVRLLDRQGPRHRLARQRRRPRPDGSAPRSASRSRPDAPAPNGPATFSATGGSNTGFTWSITKDESGGAEIVANTGAFTAGPTGSSSAVVEVVDSLGKHRLVLAVDWRRSRDQPQRAQPSPGATVAFGATGGSNSGFTWTFAPSGNLSGGTVSAAGVYKAGHTPSRPTSFGSPTRSATSATSASWSGSASPPRPRFRPSRLAGAPRSRPAAAAAPGFTWTFAANGNLSGGSVSTAGAYVAGPTGSIVDKLTATDSLGNTATVNVSVSAALALTGSSTVVPPQGDLGFASTGGAAP